ncbi:MAG: DegT/DnrJ/EryC1/StrS family aminotransferase [Pseudomonadota bacterium]
MSNVPFLDLKAQYHSIKDEIAAALQMVLETAAFAGGPFVEQFENEFAAFCQTRYSVGVGSGTDALWLVLLALGVSPGDEVITVPNTFLATAEAVSFCGAKPVFVDIDQRTYTMDPQKLDDYLRVRFRAGRHKGVKAVIPVHLFGHTADMDPILEIARSYGLFVIEDACQAHGGRYKGRSAGSLGVAGCFSFYPGKNLGAYGEAGAVVTNDAELASKIRILRDHGQSRKYYHRFIGWNARMDGFQGAVLSVKLKYLEKWNQDRRENADLYNRLLSGLDGLAVPTPADFAEHVYHIYAVRTRDRDAMMNCLARRGIHCGIHYPLPIHLQEAYRVLGLGQGSFTVAEKCANELLSLPMYPELTKNQIEDVAAAVEVFLRERQGY